MTKGEGRQQALQDRQWIAVGNALHASSELVLGDFGDGVDVMDPLDSVEVALVHRGLPGRSGGPPSAACEGRDGTLATTRA